MQSVSLKSFNSHISVVVCSFFQFGTVVKWCIGEWVKIETNDLAKRGLNYVHDGLLVLIKSKT